ncbi:PaaI family thioesterase [Aeromicrobium sp. CTD01-1L150]|uniref:PaaI family thioesterase n=1 Tax=Aeromicrobium sp. CTD01-1L150 TaxID=3341830 RepID=UPI0035C17D4A
MSALSPEQMEHLKSLSGLEFLRTAFAAPDRPPFIGDLLGLQVERIDEGEVSFSVPTRQDFANPLGVLHGGICATLLDSVMGCAVHSTLEAGVGFGTLELKVNYIRTVPINGERLVGTGSTIHVGRQVATAEGRVVDENDRLVAHATTTCMIHR